MLLEEYFIVDRGVEAALKRARKQGRRPACRRGCSSCCRTHRDIPVYPIELAGIIWYCAEKVEGGEREALKARLSSHAPQRPCPFLAGHACSIHRLRPASCRQFNVFDTPCAPEEDAFHTRRQDVMTPIGEYTERAFAATLPFYGLQDAQDKTKAARHIIHTQAVNLMEYGWKKLAEIMERLDTEKAQGRQKEAGEHPAGENPS
jgi:Fe-S-cluster containining protein